MKITEDKQIYLRKGISMLKNKINLLKKETNAIDMLNNYFGSEQEAFDYGFNCGSILESIDSLHSRINFIEKSIKNIDTLMYDDIKVSLEDIKNFEFYVPALVINIFIQKNNLPKKDRNFLLEIKNELIDIEKKIKENETFFEIYLK